MQFFDFTEEDIEFLKQLKDKRINAQYYVTEEVELENENKVKDFRLKCKEFLERTDFEEVREEIVSRLE